MKCTDAAIGMTVESQRRLCDRRCIWHACARCTPFGKHVGICEHTYTHTRDTRNVTASLHDAQALGKAARKNARASFNYVLHSTLDTKRNAIANEHHDPRTTSRRFSSSPRLPFCIIAKLRFVYLIRRCVTLLLLAMFSISHRFRRPASSTCRDLFTNPFSLTSATDWSLAHRDRRRYTGYVQGASSRRINNPTTITRD